MAVDSGGRHLRSAYRDVLQAYTRDIAAMADITREGMRHATDALVSLDLEAAECALTESDALKDVHLRCQDRALALLARENPVATELRLVLAYINIGHHLMRMSSLSKSVAKIARQHHPRPALPAEVMEQVGRMAEAAITMGDEVCTALTGPIEGLSLVDVDDTVDAIATELLAAAKSEAWQHSRCHAVETALLARYFERFADHCVDIARQLTFVATGERPV